MILPKTEESFSKENRGASRYLHPCSYPYTYKRRQQYIVHNRWRITPYLTTYSKLIDSPSAGI